MSKKIPKPAKERIQAKDQRIRYLNEWKRLFESIHKEIKVVIDESKLSSEISEITDYASFEPGWHDWKILVILPRELELEYLIGLTYDKMFSAREVKQDTFVQENPGYGYEPEVKKWEDFYRELCDIFDRNTKQVPKPAK